MVRSTQTMMSMKSDSYDQDAKDYEERYESAIRKKKRNAPAADSMKSQDNQQL